MKPMLASDWVERKLRFPCIIEPKIDGVRGLNMTGTLTGRSLKKFKNLHVTSMFSHSALVGMDGEFAAERDTHPDLCRITSSALGTIKGEPYVLWHVFDYVTPATRGLPYIQRLDALRDALDAVCLQAPALWNRLRMIPRIIVYNLEELLEWEEIWLKLGYEGLIIRDIDGVHKAGRSTPTEGGLLRIKRFVDFEFRAHTIIEGESNENEAQINELGGTFRSSHQENMVANGMIGAMLGTTLDVVKDGDTVLFEKGAEIRVGAGCLTHDQRRYYFTHQNEFLALIHKAKFFPKGIKDKPRFPTWQAFRSPEDLGGE